MKANVEVELQPFMTPNFVRQAGPNLDVTMDGPSAIPLAALDALTLDRLCHDFRAEVFKKAGKNFPPEPAPRCEECDRRQRKEQQEKNW